MVYSSKLSGYTLGSNASASKKKEEKNEKKENKKEPTIMQKRILF